MPTRSPGCGRAAPNGGIICTVGHIGSNDAIGAAIAHLGLPLSAVADDSSFPELFDLLKRQREQWHATIIPWRNLRAIFGVLRRRELLALLVDWGYRSDGIPVTLFGAWTTLPAGPATLAAKTASRIVPIITTRQPDGRLHVGWADPIDVPVHGPGRPAARHPADRRRPGPDDRAGTARVVQLQADVAGDRRGSRRPRAAAPARCRRAGRTRAPPRTSRAIRTTRRPSAERPDEAA